MNVRLASEPAAGRHGLRAKRAMSRLLVAAFVVALASAAFAGGLTDVDVSHDCAGKAHLDDFFPREPIVSGRTKYGDEYVPVGMRRALADLDGTNAGSARDFFAAARGATAPTLDKSAVSVGEWMDRVPTARADGDTARADQNLADVASRPIRQFGITHIVAEPATYAMGGLMLVCVGAWLFGRRKTG